MEESSKEIQNHLFLTAAITENINVIKWFIGKCTENKQECYDATKAVDKKGNTALHLAALFNNNQEIIKYLLALVDREARNRHQQTPFLLAVENNSNLEVCKLLYKDQSDLTAKDENGDTALHLAAALDTNQEIIEYLLEQGADREARGQHYQTPFQKAVIHNSNLEVCKLLYKDQSDLAAED